MDLSRWLIPHRRAPGKARPPRGFLPALEALEDRTVPSGFGHGFLAPAFEGFGDFGGESGVTAGPATHLRVVVPENVQPGSSFKVLVEAVDASNHLAANFTDTVSLSLGTADTGAGTNVPAPYPFTAADHGVHVFTVTLSTTGSQTITATDTTTNSTVTAGAATTSVTATPTNTTPVATQVLVITPEQAAVGVSTDVTVEVLDAAGHVVPNFTGTISLDSSDTAATASSSRHAAQATVPITYTFTARDHGKHEFHVTFATAVTAGTTTTVTAASTDPNSSLSGQATLTVYPATTVTHFAIIPGATGGQQGEDSCEGEGESARATVGTTKAFTVVALNAANQIVTGYTGTISLTSSDTAATASATATGTQTLLSGTTPFTYQFTATDNGSHTFYVTFNTPGPQTLTATDTTTTSSVGTINVKVHQSENSTTGSTETTENRQQPG
jgi:hypothetical protein